MRQHFLELKAKKHPNKILQKAYNRDSEYFNFEVLELTTLDKLNEREAYWMNYYQTLNSNFGYNHQVVHPNRTYVKKKNLKKYINRK